MNFLNRTIVVMLLIAAALVGCILFFVVLIIPERIGPALQPALTAIADPQQLVSRLVCLGVALLVSVFAILLLYLELMPGGKVRMRLKSIQGADVMMSGEAITNQLQYALDPLPGVIRAQPKVFRGKNDVVDVLIELNTTADVDVRQKTNEVMDVARTVLEGGLGLRVGKIQIQLEQMKAPKRAAPVLPKMDLPRLISAKQEEANEKAAEG
jgi:hypothetical protein